VRGNEGVEGGDGGGGWHAVSDAGRRVVRSERGVLTIRNEEEVGSPAASAIVLGR
jgi:hypothetical protein